MINAGEKRGLWKFKEPEPVTEEELIEVIEEDLDEDKEQSEEAVEKVIEKMTDDNKVEYKKHKVIVDPKTGLTEKVIVENEIVDPPADAETTPAPQPEPVKEPEKVKPEPPLSDAIRCESGPHHYRCVDETPISITPSSDHSDK